MRRPGSGTWGSLAAVFWMSAVTVLYVAAVLAPKLERWRSMWNT